MLHGGHRQVSGGLARAAVFGINDGLVSNVSLILGFAASGVDPSIVRLAGMAGAIAGAISMAAGEWISISAQNELVEREVAVEARELRHNPEEETLELASYYESHGMSADTALRAAQDVMSSPERALEVHTREEMGIDPTELPSPLRAAALSLICFTFGAVLPIIPWFTGASGTAPTVVSAAIGVVVAAIVGAAIGRYAERPIVPSMLRQVMIVLIACTATYTIGELVGVNV